MMISKILKRNILPMLISIIALTAIPVSAENMDDLIQFGNGGIGGEPVINLIEGAPPITDKLAGKTIRLQDHNGIGDTATFLEGGRMRWFYNPVPGLLRENYYIAFEISENVFFVSFVDGVTEGEDSKLYGGGWLIAFILDLNNMRSIDSFMEPDPSGIDKHYLHHLEIVQLDGFPGNKKK